MLILTTILKIQIHRPLTSIKMHLIIAPNIRLSVTNQEYHRKVRGRQANNERILIRSSRGLSQEARTIPTSLQVMAKGLLRTSASFSHQILTRTKSRSSTIINHQVKIRQKKYEMLGKQNRNNPIDWKIQMERKQEANRIGNSHSIL